MITLLFQKPPTNEDEDDDEEDEEDEDVQEEVQEGGVKFEEFIQIYEEAEAASGTYTEDMLRDALRPLETSKILDSGEIIHTITKEDISNFLTTFGDVLSDDDMKDFCAEFDGINSGTIQTLKPTAVKRLFDNRLVYIMTVPTVSRSDSARRMSNV